MTGCTCGSLALPAFQYNKGLAFSQLERDRLYLRGLLPPAVLSQEVQAERVMTNIRRWESSVNAVWQVFLAAVKAVCFLAAGMECLWAMVACSQPVNGQAPTVASCHPRRSKRNGVDQHTYLMSLQERNERLFYYVLSQVLPCDNYCA